MKVYVYLALVAIFAGAFAYNGHVQYQAGYDRRVTEERADQTQQDAKDRFDWLEQNKADDTNASWLGKGLDDISSTTAKLEGSAHVHPLPHVAAPAPLTVLNPVPGDFSVCWNAASTRDPEAVAACQAGGGDGAVSEAAVGPGPGHQQAPAAGTAARGAAAARAGAHRAHRGRGHVLQVQRQAGERSDLDHGGWQ